MVVIVAKVAALLMQGAGVLVQRRNLGIGEGEHEPALLRRRRNVGGVARRHVAQGVGLLFRPVDAARLVEGRQRLPELALVHPVERGLLPGVLNPLHVLQDRRAVGLAQRLEHPASFDAGKLRVVARENQLRAGLLAAAASARQRARWKPWPPRP